MLTQRAETASDVERQLLILGKRHVLVWRQLKIGPLLVDFLLLAIDHLLHLLVLCMQLDELPLAQGLGVAILLARSLEDVIDGVDARFGSRLELVLVLDVSSWYRLTVGLLDAWYLDSEGRLLVHLWLRNHLLEVLATHDVAHRCLLGRCVFGF